MSERYCRRVDEYGGETRCESSVGRSDGLSFSIGARALSPRGLRDGLSLCFSLISSSCRLVGACGVSGIIINFIIRR